MTAAVGEVGVVLSLWFLPRAWPPVEMNFSNLPNWASRRSNMWAGTNHHFQVSERERAQTVVNSDLEYVFRYCLIFTWPSSLFMCFSFFFSLCDVLGYYWSSVSIRQCCRGPWNCRPQPVRALLSIKRSIIYCQNNRPTSFFSIHYLAPICWSLLNRRRACSAE